MFILDSLANLLYDFQQVYHLMVADCWPPAHMAFLDLAKCRRK